MKAILVIDMPKNCEECKFYDGDCCYATAEKKWEGLSCRGVDHWKIREKWCPLKPMPLPKNRTVETYYYAEPEKKWYELSDYSRGWNACLEEIENESHISD